MKHIVTVTASGKVGSGKSAILGEIEIAMQALGVPVRYLDTASAQAEKNMTHADWQSALDMYQPEVVLVETISGTPADFDRWYQTLPPDLTRKLSFHDFARLGECFKHVLGARAPQPQTRSATTLDPHNPMPRLYVGSMNDSLYIIDTPPRPSANDAGPWVSANGPKIIIPCGVNSALAEKLVAAWNDVLDADATERSAVA